MSEGKDNGPKIIQFKPQEFQTSISSEVLLREELASMIRRVLHTSEIFKMNAPKSKKKNCNVEVIDFIVSHQEEEKRNG